MPVVCITGAAGGLGKAFSNECAQRGYDLFLTDMNESSLDMLAQSIVRCYGVKVGTFACNLTVANERDLLKKALSDQYGEFNMLINVAGVDHEGLFESLTVEQILTTIHLNIEGTVMLTHSLLPMHSSADTFRIINVCSLAAFQPMPYKSLYAASKKFLLDWSYAIYEELKDYATVTALCPAGLPTTPWTVKSIDSQGIIGSLTTKNVGVVARDTVAAALKGRKLVIPGVVNKVAAFASDLLPRSLAVKFVSGRWAKTRDIFEQNESKS